MRRLASIRQGLALRPLLAALPLTLASGCGPSFEAIQEGDLRFAHCDRLDLDPKIAASHRLHCWREWRRVYTYGQTRDRVEYAQRRIAEVLSGDPDPPFVLPDGTRARRSPAGSPEPNPALSSPPPIVPLSGAEPTDARDGDPIGFSTGCRSRCESTRAHCAPGCESQPTGCNACESSFHACLDNCKSGSP
jgi:hypothetical protein